MWAANEAHIVAKIPQIAELDLPGGSWPVSMAMFMACIRRVMRHYERHIQLHVLLFVGTLINRSLMI